MDAEAEITLRPATRADLDLLRRWDEQPHVVASDPNDDWGWEVELARSPEWREQLIAELDGRPIGFVQIIDPAREESRYWGDAPAGLRAVDIWIGEEADLGRGYGTTMMRLALARCFSDPAVTAVLIDPLASNTRAHRFYERLGFRFVERRRFGEDDCFVYRLERADWAAPVPSTGASMYGLIGKIRAAPGQRDALAAILLEGTGSMPGCLSYVVATDPEDGDGLWVTEVWDSRESHRASLALPAVQAAIEKGRPLIAGFANRVETTPLGGHGLAADAG